MSLLEPIVPELATLPDGQRCLLWRCESQRHQLSCAPVGGGSSVVDWVVNLQVAGQYARHDLAVHAAEVASHLGLAGQGVTMLTAADVGAVASAVEQGVRADVTVGISTPTWAAAESFDEGNVGPGTINIVVQLPILLTAAAAVNVVITATEAKTQALIEHRVAGTGTATDAVVVLWPKGVENSEPIQFAGPRSEWGGRVARVVHAAVGVGVQDWRKR
jgi:adenosylcobinamide hydrolase